MLSSIDCDHVCGVSWILLHLCILFDDPYYILMVAGLSAVSSTGVAKGNDSVCGALVGDMLGPDKRATGLSKDNVVGPDLPSKF